MVTRAKTGSESGAHGNGDSAATLFQTPPPLKPGDRVALFSPSSHTGGQPPEFQEKALAQLRDWDLRPDPIAEPQPRHLYLAGTDAERAHAFQTLYCDPEIKALFATRGGYGAARMLPLLDSRRIASAAPKAVVGMSDVAALLSYLHRVAGIATYHGPCLAAPLHMESPHQEENLESLHQALFHPEKQTGYPCGLLHLPQTTDAHVSGPLVGGCLSVLAAAMGTPWAPQTKGAILFLEDVDEKPYRIDRYLTQFRQAGAMEGVKAVVFGDLKNCEGHPPGLLAQMLRDIFQDAPYPVATGLQAGHGELNLTLPLGRDARLDFEGTDYPGGPATLYIGI